MRCLPSLIGSATSVLILASTSVKLMVSTTTHVLGRHWSMLSGGYKRTPRGLVLCCCISAFRRRCSARLQRMRISASSECRSDFGFPTFSLTRLGLVLVTRANRCTQSRARRDMMRMRAAAGHRFYWNRFCDIDGTSQRGTLRWKCFTACTLTSLHI